MPRVGTQRIGFKVLDEFRYVDVVVNVNATGKFYANIPAEADAFFEPGFRYGRERGGEEAACATKRDRKQLFTRTLDDLVEVLRRGLREAHRPHVTEEHVIRFNIESHVNFALTEDGEIAPNAGYPGARWMHDQIENRHKFGNHDAVRAAKGGYSLTIGARALTKTTRTVGTNSKVEYAPYYKGGSHLGHDNPAQKLNSWTAFSLPQTAREIPYTDDAAMFFHNLMLGMARLSRMVQDATFADDDILHLIATRPQGLLGAPTTEDTE